MNKTLQWLIDNKAELQLHKVIDDFYCVFWVDTNENWFIAMHDLVKYRNYTLNKEQHG